MIYIETCPKCGHDLQNIVICTYPPIPKKVCWNCGWSWTGEADKVTRVPFNPDPENPDSDWIKDAEGDKLNYTNVSSLTKEPPITFYEDNCLASFPNNTNASVIYNTAFNNEACKNCSNNPKNGGSGICNCTLGLMEITV